RPWTGAARSGIVDRGFDGAPRVATARQPSVAASCRDRCATDAAVGSRLGGRAWSRSVPSISARRARGSVVVVPAGGARRGCRRSCSADGVAVLEEEGPLHTVALLVELAEERGCTRLWQ